ncbi:unnamed protein product [Cunninghamella blakesleeana]
MIQKQWIIALMFILSFITLIECQGISRTGKKDGKAIFSRAKNISPGKYHLQNVKTKKYLAFLPGTLVQPTASKKSASTIWVVKRYKTKIFSIGHSNGSLKKAISARWTKGRNDAAVLWQDELKYKKRSLYTKRYDPIVPDKQNWVMVPVSGRKNTFKIIAYSHLYNMTPTCLSGSSTGGHTSRGGTVLKKCKYNTNDPNLYWTFQKA